MAIPASVARPPRYLSQTEVRALFAEIEDPRDRVLFGMIYLYGLRVSEVALLACGDVDLMARKVTIRRVKGGVWTERPLFSSIRDQLERHLSTIPHDALAPLFPGRRGALQKRQIQSLFNRHRDAAGLDTRYTTHGLRHSIATHLLDAGVSLDFVQDHLGHRNIESTTIYARLTDQRRRAIFRDLEESPWIVQPSRIDHEQRPFPSAATSSVAMTRNSPRSQPSLGLES